MVGGHLAAPALKVSLETSQNGPFQGHHNLSRKKYFVDCCKTLVLLFTLHFFDWLIFYDALFHVRHGSIYKSCCLHPLHHITSHIPVLDSEQSTSPDHHGRLSSTQVSSGRTQELASEWIPRGDFHGGEGHCPAEADVD